MTFKNTIWFFSIMLLAGCEEQFNWPLNNKDTDLIVVEAVLTNENKNHLIKLTRPYQEQNETPQPITGAIVAIRNKNGTIPTVEYPAGSGLYYTDSTRFVANIDYTLYIQYQGKPYFASATQPSVESLTPISFRSAGDGLYTLNFNKTGSEPNYIKYFIFWKYLNSCPAGDDCQAKQIFYDLKNVDINEQFKPDQEQVVFPAGTIIIRKKYSVSDEYREYLRGMLSETAWRGGVFDVFPANAPTNLSEGAVGFFAISTVVTDTTIIVP
jgi:Domain of unknown function (DUF4249)